MACVFPALNQIPAINITSDDIPYVQLLTDYLKDKTVMSNNLVWTLIGAPSNAIALDNTGCLTVTDVVTATNMKVKVTATTSGASTETRTLSVTVKKSNSQIVGFLCNCPRRMNR
jgi:hypothetical protein